MKKTFLVLLLGSGFCFSGLGFFGKDFSAQNLFAQSQSSGILIKNDESENIIYTEDDVPLDSKTGFPVIEKKPFPIFNYGLAGSLVTRLEVQEKRSNFVWQDGLLGAYVSVQSVNMKPVNSIARLAVYYPVHNTFNGMDMKQLQMLRGAIDFYAGPMLETDMWKYVHIKGSGGLHFMYQLTDEYHLLYLGVGLLAGLELPLAKNWTIVTNGIASLDYPNLGSNKNQIYNVSWNYQLELGVRFSKKNPHRYYYIGKRNPEQTNSGEQTSEQTGEL